MSNVKGVTECIETLKEKENSRLRKELQQVITKFYKSAEVVLQEECFERLGLIVNELHNKQEHCVKCVEQMLWVLLEEIQALTQSKQQNHSIEPTDYHILQQSLQKAESEVRKHIRIEQQLKIYLDGIQEKNQQLENQLKIEEQKNLQLFETVKLIDQEKKQLQKKIKKLQEKNKLIQDKDLNNHTKLKPHKSAKFINEQFTRAQHSISMYKSRPTLISNNIHSKSKISDKSSQKQFKQTKPVKNEKNSRMKKLDDMIEVNLSSDVHKESYQDNTFVPTEQDVRLFKQMTKTVQMKQAYKRPVRKITKYKTESNNAGENKQAMKQQSKNSQYSHGDNYQCREYRSVSMYK